MEVRMDSVFPAGKTRAADYALLHVIVLAWSLTAILGRMISLAPVVIVVWRTGIAAIIMLAIVQARRLSWPRGRSLWPILAGGVLIGAHWILFFLFARVGSIAVGLAGLSTLPLWVAALEPIFIHGRRWSWVEGMLAVGVMSGMLLLDLSDHGLLIGVAAAAMAAGLSILNARLVRHHPAMVISCIEMATACGFCALGAQLFPPAGGLVWLPLRGDWPWLLILAIICTVFAFSACVWVQRRLSAFSVGMASNLEPVYGMILAPIVFGASESQPPRFYMGAAVIIGFVIFHTVLVSPKPARPDCP